MPSVSSKHTAVIPHINSGCLLSNLIYYHRGETAEECIFSFLPHSSHHIVTLFSGGNKFGNFFRRILQVRIQSNNQVTAYQRKTGHNSGMLPIIAIQNYRNNFSWISRAGITHNCSGIIFTSVIHEKDFKLHPDFAAYFQCTLNQLLKTSLFIINRNNHTEAVYIINSHYLIHCSVLLPSV